MSINFENMNFDEQFYENMFNQAASLYAMMKDMKEIQAQVKNTESRIVQSEQRLMRVGEFMIDFYNEYREHDALTLAQVKELKEAQHYKTSEITKILCPRLDESHKRGSAYLKEWNRVNKGLWSIFKRNVNGVSIPYDRTPKIKFSQGLKYMNKLSVADYLAYREQRWSDIQDFVFDESLAEEQLTLEKVIKRDEI